MNSVTITGISISQNNEKALEFWIYIYSYVDGTYTGLEISWDLHAKVEIVFSSSVYKTRCYPFVDMSSSYAGYYEDTISQKSWYRIRCAVNTFTKKYYTNQLPEIGIAPAIPSFSAPTTTKLFIADKVSTNLNYGFQFVRELKLWSSYNFAFFDTSRL